MNIAIVGAGPVGLYAAILMRHLYPAGQVHLFEKRGAGQLSGFGYTLHAESLRLLGIPHPAVANSIAQKGTSPFTRRTIALRNKCTDLDPEVCKSMPIIGVEYDNLIDSLKTQAVLDGAVFHYETVINELDALAEAHDLVILANGANSQFLERFDPMKVQTGLAYAWGKSRHVSAEMAMSVGTFGDIPYICHKYPVTDAATAMIVEVREEQAEEAAKQIELLPDTLKFFPQGVAFRKIPLCLCRKRVFRNIVCIGDAALAQYFAAGAGLYFGLMQTGLLFHHLDVTPGTIEQKLRAYDAKAKEFLRYQWKPNQLLIKKKRGLLAGYAGMSDEAVLDALVADG